MKKVVALTGAGISAESGLSTFRDSNGLWKRYRFEDIASPAAWHNNPNDVLEFYAMRRRQLFEVEPNPAHFALAQLEKKYEVTIVTQNVDNLHERAGSTNVVHLHGELMKARSTVDPDLVYELNHWELKWGDTCDKGSQLRPHIVWFGEQVTMIPVAIEIVRKADILLVVGTSLVVYPAAGLMHYAPPLIPKYYVDPKAFEIGGIENLTVITEKAGDAMPPLAESLLKIAKPN